MTDHPNIYVPQPKVAALPPAILPAIRDRWSPYAFAERKLAPGVLQQCFVAASWAASSYNEQPWYFLVAERDQKDEFERMLNCLLEANQVWAKYASALVLTVSAESFSRNAVPTGCTNMTWGKLWPISLCKPLRWEWLFTKWRASKLARFERTTKSPKDTCRRPPSLSGTLPSKHTADKRNWFVAIRPRGSERGLISLCSAANGEKPDKAHPTDWKHCKLRPHRGGLSPF